MISKIYTQDWFGRTEADYIFNPADRMKGIIQIPNHKYSSFLYNEDKAERICSDLELMKREIGDMVNAIGLTSVSIKFSEKNPTACTNGSFIEIGIGDDYKSVSDCYEKLDRIIGMAIHESCHCLYTDFSHVNKVISKYPGIVHHIHNIIEDEMIEEKLCKIYPGYHNFLNKLKYNIFEKNNDTENVPADYEEIDKVLEILFYLIRYPKFISKIDSDVLGKYECLFAEIKKIMKDNNCFKPNNDKITLSSTEAAIQIYELLKEFIKDDITNSKGNSKGEADQDSESEESEEEGSNKNSEEEDSEGEADKDSESEKESKGKSNKSKGFKKEESDDEGSDEDSGEDDSENNDNSEDAGDSKDNESETRDDDEDNKSVIDKVSFMEDEPEEESEIDADEIMNNIGKDLGGIIAVVSRIYENVSSTSEQTNIKELKVYQEEISDSIKEFNNFNWANCPENKIKDDTINGANRHDINKYNAFKREINGYINLTKKLIVPNDKKQIIVNSRFNRNGTLDPTRLANAMCNEQTVYIRKEQKSVKAEPKYALAIVLDESGSMEDRGLNLLASKLAVLLYEAMKDFSKIQLFVYGHGDVIYNYIDLKDHKNKYVLGSRHTQWSQDEERSYTDIVNDIKSQTKLPIVMFNITDSCYCNDPNTLKNLIKDFKDDPKQKTFVNLICLGHNNETTADVTGYNNKIYGPGNWVIYNRNTITSEITDMINSIAKIIHKNVKF